MMNHSPTIETKRLVLRPFAISDSDRVKELAGDRKIYETTLNLPHPYEDGMAEKWISSQQAQFYNGKGVNLAVTLKQSGELIGSIGLGASERHKRAELGYWIGVPYWGKGYCTEASRAIIAYGFRSLPYHKITSRHLEGNPASGKVMGRSGMKKEGTLTDEVFKDGRFHTIVVYGLINSEQSRAANLAPLGG